MSTTKPLQIKVCVMGGGGVGKSALTVRFITGSFITDYDPTIEDSYRKLVQVDDQTALLDILDTAGQDSFWAMQDQWIRESQIFIVMYSIDQNEKESWAQCEFLRNKIIKVKESNNIPIILVGTKCDLTNNRQITSEQLKQRGNEWKCKYFETSAKTGQNLNEIFQSTVPEYIKFYKNDIDLYQEVKVNKKCCNSSCCGSNNDPMNSNGDDVAELDEGGDQIDDQIQFFKVAQSQLPADNIASPVLSLKNFKILRTFNLSRFMKAMLCGLFLPIVIIAQTMAFLMYSERMEPSYYPKFYLYDDIHYSLLLDFLGIVIGRKPGQDPEAITDRRWFLRQNGKQLCDRIFITICICLVFIICCYNLSQVNDTSLNVSLMETVGPFLIFWILWLLLSVWIGYESQLQPTMPSPARLRSITLFFGESFSHRTSAYKFLRAYESSRNNKWKLPALHTFIIFCLGAIYSAIPLITRATVGDDSDGLDEKRLFLTVDDGLLVEIGAIVVNFTLISSFIYAIEVQYNKHFENYRQWMYDLTMLLNKDNNTKDKDEDDHYIPQKGNHFAKDLFLSLTRRGNALGWLEIRSFLAAKGQLLFAQQELPTLWILLLTIALTIFLFYRVYFIDRNPLESILFSGTAMLAIICLVSLIRISITGYQFESLQDVQERLVGEQKFFMRCNNQQIIDGVSNQNDGMLIEIDLPKPANKPITLIATNSTDKKEIEMVKMNENNNDNNNVEDENKYDDENDENKPLITRSNMNDKINAMDTKLDNVNWYSHNIGFIEDMIFIVERRDIYPKLFKVKLNSVLAKSIAGIVITGIATTFRLFVPTD